MPILRLPSGDIQIWQSIGFYRSGYSTNRAEAVQKRFTKFAAKAAEQSSQRELLTIRVARDCEAMLFGRIYAAAPRRRNDWTGNRCHGFWYLCMLPNTVEGMISIRDMSEDKLWNNDHNVCLYRKWQFRLSAWRYRKGDLYENRYFLRQY